jgi:hypothetical protein
MVDFPNKQIALALNDPAHLSFRLNSQNDDFMKQIASPPQRIAMTVSPHQNDN